MLPVRQMSPASAMQPDAMTAGQRCSLLALLVGLGSLVNVAFNQQGPSLDLFVRFDSGFAMLGGFIAQSCLLAVWAALGQQPLAVRLPWSLGVAALLGLAAAWGEARQRLAGGEGLGTLACMIFMVGLQAVLLLPLRRYWKWRVHTVDETTSAKPSQFSLQQLLIWTTAVAAILAAARSIGFGDDASLSDLADLAMQLSTLGLIVAVVCTPLMIPSLSLILGDRKRSRAAVWFVAMTMFSTLSMFLTCLAFDRMVNRGPWDGAVEDALETSLPLQVGFVAMLVLGLVVTRLCGVRLSRGSSDGRTAKRETDIPPLPVALAPPLWWRSPFACGIALLGLVAAFLVWPSRMVEQERQENLRKLAIYEEWNEVGADVMVSGDEITSATFEAKQPVRNLALDKLCNSPYAATIYSLQFSGSSLTDDQMHYIAACKSLEWLLLDGTQITDAGLVHLRGLSKLRILNLNGTRVGDEGLKIVQDMDSLNELGLNDTAVTDAGLVQLHSLQKLKALGLARTRVSDLGLQEVQRLPNLQVVFLQGTVVTDAGLAELHSRLPGLAPSGALAILTAASPVIADGTR